MWENTIKFSPMPLNHTRSRLRETSTRMSDGEFKAFKAACKRHQVTGNCFIRRAIEYAIANEVNRGAG